MLAQWGVPTWPMKPRLTKAMRVHAISPLVYQGMLWVPESMREDRKGMPIAWSEPFLEQVCAFAGEGSVEHDEFVDVLSQAFTYLKDRGMLLATPEVEYIDREDKLDHDREEARRLATTQTRARKPNPYG